MVFNETVWEFFDMVPDTILQITSKKLSLAEFLIKTYNTKKNPPP